MYLKKGGKIAIIYFLRFQQILIYKHVGMHAGFKMNMDGPSDFLYIFINKQ